MDNITLQTSTYQLLVLSKKELKRAIYYKKAWKEDFLRKTLANIDQLTSKGQKEEPTKACLIYLLALTQATFTMILQKARKENKCLRVGNQGLCVTENLHRRNPLGENHMMMFCN